MEKRIGRRTLRLSHPPAIISHACIGGRHEGKGPLAADFDELSQDSFFGEKTWEKAESTMQKRVLGRALEKAGMNEEDLDFIFAGDLLNQCIGSAFSLRDFAVPFYGLYGACSTMGESLSLAALLLDGGFGTTIAAMTSSHFCTAERQYRMPVPYGSQRSPTAQWTATAAGCSILSSRGEGPRITHVTCGKVVDKGIKDANNMGAAMAPAACDTIAAHLRDTGRAPDFYDLIVTGDLGLLGSQLLLELLRQEGFELSNHADCGALIFDPQSQDVHCGGSGCGCCASVLTGYLLNGMQQGQWKNILFCPTGALHSPTASFQGESIPGICHAIAISAVRQSGAS